QQESEDGRSLRLYLPRRHVRPANLPFTDPAAVAQLFFGVPYLWGGNSVRGIDCSGLVQAACLASGIACPGDSDLQEVALGTRLSETIAVGQKRPMAFPVSRRVREAVWARVDRAPGVSAPR
ncbi:hypothetical protein LCGC14_2284430, partial [marine sediment metagenome]